MTIFYIYFSISFIIASIFCFIVLKHEIEQSKEVNQSVSSEDLILIIVSGGCLGVFWPLCFALPLAYYFGSSTPFNGDKK